LYHRFRLAGALDLIPCLRRECRLERTTLNKKVIKWIYRQCNIRHRCSAYFSWDSAGSWFSNRQLGLASFKAKIESRNLLFYSRIYI